MRRVAQFGLASAAVLVIGMAQVQATELYSHPPVARARTAAALPHIVYGPALPQYLPVRPSYLVDQGPSDDIPSNPYGTPASPYAPPPAYGYVDTDDYYGAGVGYGGYYAFGAAPLHYRHRRSYEAGVNVYRGPSASHWSTSGRHSYRHAALHGGADRPWIGRRPLVAGPHGVRHGVHRMHGHAASPRIRPHARPAMPAPMRRH